MTLKGIPGGGVSADPGAAAGWQAFYADRLQRKNSATDEGLRAHFEAELKQAILTMEAMGIKPPAGGEAPPLENKSQETENGSFADPGKQQPAILPENGGEAPPVENKAQEAGGKPPVEPGKQALAPENGANGGSESGTGPNSIEITNTQNHPIRLGKFKNQESTTDPSAEIVLKPGETGTIRYENGEAGFIAQADADGKYLPTASRLEYQADADGNQKYPDVSYIDGRNASISLTDGAGFNKGDTLSIAGEAPDSIVTTDSAGNRTITGWYDGSTAEMQEGGQFLESRLGTNGAYIHPDDDRRGQGSNPMTSTQSSVLKATFGEA
jgi:hypothetical protein